VTVERIASPLGAAEQADIDLVFYSNVGHLDINALDEPDNLVEAEFAYRGEYNLSPGDLDASQRVLELRANDMTPPDMFAETAMSEWQVRLAQNVPLDVNTDLQIDSAMLDLMDIQLSYLVMDLRVGEFQIALPYDSPPYDAVFDGDTTHFMLDASHGELWMGEMRNSVVDVRGDMDMLRIEVPENLDVVIEAPDGLPSSLDKPDFRHVMKTDDDDPDILYYGDRDAPAGVLTIVIDGDVERLELVVTE
jgi:hypothetical protein